MATEEQNLIEKVAHILCSSEVRRSNPPSLEYLVEEIERTWKRYISEAEQLIDSFRKAGIEIK